MGKRSLFQTLNEYKKNETFFLSKACELQKKMQSHFKINLLYVYFVLHVNLAGEFSHCKYKE